MIFFNPVRCSIPYSQLESTMTENTVTFDGRNGTENCLKIMLENGRVILNNSLNN